jgi:hypothetical protein
MLLLVPGVVPHTSQAVINALWQLVVREAGQWWQAENLQSNLRKEFFLWHRSWWWWKALDSRLA